MDWLYVEGRVSVGVTVVFTSTGVEVQAHGRLSRQRWRWKGVGALSKMRSSLLSQGLQVVGV